MNPPSKAFRSRLYECEVMHARLHPRRHRFAYRIFVFALDLDELAALQKGLHLLSINRGNVYSFRESDYLPTEDAAPASGMPPGPGRLKARVAAYVAAQGISTPVERVELVTLPRIAGYGFNPVSFYFCRDAQGTPLAAVAEVTNTFREMKLFFLGGPDPVTGRFQVRRPKHFYVSPFSDVDVAFDFRVELPDSGLRIQIDDYVGTERTLTSTMIGDAATLTDARLAWFLLKYPLLTLRVITLIHWHALKLYLKRVPWFRKAARPADQREVFRPHVSLLQPKTTDAS